MEPLSNMFKSWFLTWSIITRLSLWSPSPNSFCISSASCRSLSAWRVRCNHNTEIRQSLRIKKIPDPFSVWGYRQFPHPLSTGSLLLIRLPCERWECFDVPTVNGGLDDAADPGLILLGAAQSRRCDGVHVSLVLLVQLDYVLLLLVRAFVFLLKVEDVLHGNLCMKREKVVRERANM